MKSRGARKGGRGSNVLPPGVRGLTVAQLAEMWQVSQRTIRRRIKEGQIRVVRIGRAVRIPE
jgi:excisionase family DNA binding protein